MRQFLILGVIMTISISFGNCLPATNNNNNQTSRQVQRATQGRIAPPPISLGRSPSPQQRVSSSTVGQTRQSPRLAAQRQAHPYHQGSHTASQQRSIHSGTSTSQGTRGQIAQQRRLDREEQRGLQQVTGLRTPQTRQRTGGVRQQQQQHHTTPPLQQTPTTHQPVRTPPVQRTRQIGVTPTRQRANPAHGLREIVPSTRQPGQQHQQHAERPNGQNTQQSTTATHRRPGSWVQIINPPTELESRRYQAGMKTPPKRE
jgi:hypothetical protein